MAIETAADRLTFLDADEFGVEAVFAGLADPVAGIFDAEYFGDLDGLGGAVVETTQPVFRCRAADVASIANGAALTIPVDGADTAFTVTSKQPDGTGMIVLLLQET